jgi:hypothetical protein
MTAADHFFARCCELCAARGERWNRIYICIQSRWTIRFCRAVREISRPQPALYGVDFFLSALSGRNHRFLRASQFICACRSFNSETLSPRRFAIRLLIDIFRVSIYVYIALLSGRCTPSELRSADKKVAARPLQEIFILATVRVRRGECSAAEWKKALRLFAPRACIGGFSSNLHQTLSFRRRELSLEKS